MLVYVLRRLAYSVVTLLVLSLTVFLIVRATGDPARVIAGAEASADEVERIRIDLGLDRPLVGQYGDFLGDLVRGDLGRSFQFRQPVLDVYLDRLPGPSCSRRRRSGCRSSSACRPVCSRRSAPVGCRPGC